MSICMHMCTYISGLTTPSSPLHPTGILLLLVGVIPRAVPFLFGTGALLETSRGRQALQVYYNNIHRNMYRFPYIASYSLTRNASFSIWGGSAVRDVKRETGAAGIIIIIYNEMCI